MTYFGAEFFGNALSQNTFSAQLRELALQDNRLIADGVVSVANAIVGCCKLEVLQLDNCMMGVLGALRLSTSLLTCTNLTELHIAG